MIIRKLLFPVLLCILTVSAAYAVDDPVVTTAKNMLKQMRVPGQFKTKRQLPGWSEVTFQVPGSEKLPVVVYVSEDGQSAVMGEVFYNGKPLSALTKYTSPKPFTAHLNVEGRPRFGSGEDVFVFLAPADPHYEDLVKRFSSTPKEGMRFVIKLLMDKTTPKGKVEAQYRRLLQMAGMSVPREAVLSSYAEEDALEAKEVGIQRTPALVARGMVIRSSL